MLLPPSPCGGRQSPPSLPPFTNSTIATARERACPPPSSSSCVGARVWAALQGPTSLHAPHESRCFANLGGQPLLPCALCAALCSHRALPGHCPFACPPSYGPEPTIGSLSFGTAREFQMRKNSDNSNKIRCSSHESLACLGTLKLNQWPLQGGLRECLLDALHAPCGPGAVRPCLRIGRPALHTPPDLGTTQLPHACCTLHSAPHASSDLGRLT